MKMVDEYDRLENCLKFVGNIVITGPIKSLYVSNELGWLMDTILEIIE